MVEQAIASIGASALFAGISTAAVMRYMLKKHDEKLEKHETQFNFYVEKAVHEASIKQLHDRITKGHDESRKAYEDMAREFLIVAKQLASIDGYIRAKNEG